MLGFHYFFGDGLHGKRISFVAGGDFAFPLVDVWDSLIIKGSWLQSSGPNLVQHQYFIYIRFFVLVSSVSCLISGFSPVEAEGELRRLYYVTSLPGSED